MTITIPEFPTGEIHEINIKNIKILDIKRKIDTYAIQVTKRCGEMSRFETSDNESVQQLLNAVCGNESLMTI